MSSLPQTNSFRARQEDGRATQHSGGGSFASRASRQPPEADATLPSDPNSGSAADRNAGGGGGRGGLSRPSAPWHPPPGPSASINKPKNLNKQASGPPMESVKNSSMSVRTWVTHKKGGGGGAGGGGQFTAARDKKHSQSSHKWCLCLVASFVLLALTVVLILTFD